MICRRRLHSTVARQILPLVVWSWIDEAINDSVDLDVDVRDSTPIEDEPSIIVIAGDRVRCVKCIGAVGIRVGTHPDNPIASLNRISSELDFGHYHASQQRHQQVLHFRHSTGQMVAAVVVAMVAEAKVEAKVAVAWEGVMEVG